MPITYDGGDWITWSGTITTSNTWNTPVTITACGTTTGWYQLGYLNDSYINVANNVVQPEPERTPEEQERRNREHRERIRRAGLERQEAETRAEALLLSFLSEQQRGDYRNNQHIVVIGSAGGRYRIRPGLVGNIDWLDGNGAVGGSLCCHPRSEALPHPDIMLAQMLALITDEEAFVRLANRYNGAVHPIRARARAAVDA